MMNEKPYRRTHAIIDGFRIAFWASFIYAQWRRSSGGIAITVLLAVINIPLAILSLRLKSEEPEYQRPLTKRDAVVMVGSLAGLVAVFVCLSLVLK